ncbi:hypothetical protein COM55_18860 [Bacillus pseudomycoides]|uniref:hypothetical protein n=1 Tax=Bacillus pseudomycoides TaxID=64104 RepID=UPI000BF18D7F|nr:hypothetical protein [Bacillus pseudomycoides]PEK66220.1 hypothetical protein CN590_17020 [Bacillus pseudomycoides]PGE83755.1 hypothetical protein COM55_18860 [Bacillus pseudomycoides]
MNNEVLYYCPQCNEEVGMDTFPDVKCLECGYEDECELCQECDRELISLNSGSGCCVECSEI